MFTNNKSKKRSSNRISAIKKQKKEAWKRKKRREYDIEAKKVNSPNGGCFHSYRYIKTKLWEDRHLEKRSKELTGECIVYKVSPEEIEKMCSKKEYV